MKQIPNDLFFAWVESEIAEGRSVQIRLKGTSMYPLLREGKDEVILSACPEKELKPMDVVLFRYHGIHILHRITHRNDDLLTMQGDGSFSTRENCSTADVVGRVEAVVRPSGKVIPADDWKWKLPSYIWCKMGIFRRPLLRILFLYNSLTTSDARPVA